MKAKARRPLPLDSPNWVPILDALKAILPRTGNWYLAARDLRKMLRRRRGGIRSMRRRVYGEGPDGELLPCSFWDAHELRPIKSRPGPFPYNTLWILPLGGPAIREYAFFIWKPDLDKISPTEAAAKRARRKSKPRKRHADKVTASLPPSTLPAPPPPPPTEDKPKRASTEDKPKRRGSLAQEECRRFADRKWPDRWGHIATRDIIYAAERDKEFRKIFPGDAFPKRDVWLRALGRRD